MVRFVCERGHGRTFVGEVGVDESGRMWWSELPDGTGPEDAQRPGKVLLVCSRCGHEKQVSAGNMRAALAVVEASSRRVVAYPI